MTLREELDRLRYLIEYALRAPNLESCKTILVDAITGLAGHPDLLHERELPAWVETARRSGVEAPQ